MKYNGQLLPESSGPDGDATVRKLRSHYLSQDIGPIASCRSPNETALIRKQFGTVTFCANNLQVENLQDY